MSLNKFVGSSLVLFLNYLLVAAGGWFFWLIISRLTSASEVGQATTVYSLVVLVTTLTQLGLEYPLLKRSASQRSRILGTAIVIELAITVVTIPIAIYILNNLYEGSLQRFVAIAIGILFLSSVDFVSRFLLLGISQARTILVIDTVGMGIKFFVGYALVTMGLGAFGILLAFLAHAIVATAMSLYFAIKVFGFGFAFEREIQYIKEILKEGIVNIPSKLSGMLIFSLSIILLASFGVKTSDIGQFYIALMITIAGGSFVLSMAYMVVPASSISAQDLSSHSIRIGVSFTAPIIAALIISPKLILSLLGAEYVSAEIILLVLSIGILPFSVVMNSISKFNYLSDSRKVLSIGSIQTVAFLLAFSLLVPYYGTIGAAFAILIAFFASFIPSLIWSERILLRYVLNSGIAIVAGCGLGYIIYLLDNDSLVVELAAMLTSISVTLLTIIALKNISTDEIRQLLKAVLARNPGASLRD
jgi:O-antigen/teichoic acid export membrane protein